MANARETWSRMAPEPLPLQPNQHWNVFLSYRSVNRRWVINLYDVLCSQGHKVFLDQCTILPGDLLSRSLEAALSTSQAGVLVWSSATADSEWVRGEYEVMERLARTGRFRFVPVRLDTAALPPFAENRLFLDFSQYPDGPNGSELMRLLHAVVGKVVSPEAARFASEQDEFASDCNVQIKSAIKRGRPEELQQLFDTGGLPWETSAALACATAEGLTKLEAYDLAIAMLTETARRFPRAIRPAQLMALALARRARPGDLDAAQKLVGGLYERGERDPETVGIYARTWMDRYDLSKNILELRQSRDRYAEAFESAQDDYYTGINAAAKSALLGTPADLGRARELAAKVQALVGTARVPGDYWKTATVAEAHLLLGSYAEAADRYADALAIAPEELGSHKSTWKQACRLLASLRPPEDDRRRLREVFGHLPDCP